MRKTLMKQNFKMECHAVPSFPLREGESLVPKLLNIRIELPSTCLPRMLISLWT